MEDTDVFKKDCYTIFSQIKHQEKQLRFKRRWLMRLPTSKSERKQLRGPKFLKEYRSLPETILREDDIFYETIKTGIEESFGGCAAEREHNVVQNGSQLIDSHNNIIRRLLSCLDAFTNKDLYQVASILTGGSIKFEKTRPQMKKIIRKSLWKDSENQNNHWQKNAIKHLSLILNDQRNFRGDCRTFLTPTLKSHGAAVRKVLDELEDLPFEALLAMFRKIRGKGVIPKFQRHRHGWSRGYVINRVRKISERMLFECGKVGKEQVLQEPLVKAMAIAGLSQKLKLGCQNTTELEFYQFSPEIKSLQDEIVKAVRLIETNIRIEKLKTMRNLLDPHSDVPNSCLRTTMKKMLIEYLFECSDMDTIPKSLLEILAMINRSSQTTPYKCFPKEEIKEEVERVLNLSAQTKQIVWDLLPDHEFDQDFADAYMEELEESDDGDGSDSDYDGLKKSQSCRFSSFESDDQVEGFGDLVAVNSWPPSFATSRNGDGTSARLTPGRRVCSDSVIKLEPEHLAGVYSDFCGTVKTETDDYQVESKVNVCLSGTDANSFSPFFTPKERLNCNSYGKYEADLNTTRDTGKSRDFFSSNFLLEDTKFIPSKQRKHGNQYVKIQEACDETSVVAYNLIGHMLEKFAHEEEVDLDGSDTSYLRSNSFVQKCTRVSGEKRTLSQEDVGTSNIVKMVEELLPSLPKSGIEKLKKLMDA